MNITTRYILTATAVGVGLFTVGATANALGGNGSTDLDPIGDPVVLPSGPSLSDDSSSLEEIDAPEAEDLDDLAGTPSPTGIPDTEGAVTSPGSRMDDDDYDDVDDDDYDDDDDDDDEHGVEIEDEDEDDDSVDD